MKFLKGAENRSVEKIFFYSILLIIAAVILSAEYLPLVDLPQHAGQVSALDSLLKGQNANWTQDVEINWDTPYLLGYALILLFYQFFSINASINIVIVISFFLFIYATNQLRKSYFASSIVNWIAIPSFFGFAYEWGFVTFILATPIGILFYLLNKAWVDSKNSKYLLPILIVGTILYFSHILVFAFFCYFSYFYFLVSSILKKNGTNYSISFPKLKYFVIYTLVYFVFAGLLLRYVSKEDALIKVHGAIDGYPTNIITFSSFPQKFHELLYFPWITNIINPIISNLSLVVVGVLLLLMPIMMGYRLRKSLRYFFPVCAFLLMWFALPDRAFNTSFIYQRYASLFLIFYYLIWAKPEHALLKNGTIFRGGLSKGLFALLIMLLISKTIFNTVSFNRDQDTQDYNIVVNSIKPDSRIVYLPDIDQRTSRKTLSSFSYIYFPLWYQAKNSGWSDFNFAWFLPQIVRFKTNSVPEVTARIYPIATENIINLKSCIRYDYLLVKTKMPNNMINYAIANSNCQGNKRILTRHGNWLLLGAE